MVDFVTLEMLLQVLLALRNLIKFLVGALLVYLNAYLQISLIVVLVRTGRVLTLSTEDQSKMKIKHLLNYNVG